MKAKTITVKDCHNDALELEALWVGRTFAVTRGVFFGKTHKFRITHIPTGAALGDVYKFKQAKQAAEKLDQQPLWRRVKGPPKTEKIHLKYKSLLQEALSE